MTDILQQPDHSAIRRAVVASCVIVAAGVVIGLAAGFIWAAVAPRVVYQVVTTNPPTAYATNPETSAFIAADGWYSLLAVAGGVLIGLLGYLAGVRRYGPIPMAGIVLGSTAAAFICGWLGHRQSGAPGFNHLLATSKPGTLLHAPISLGSHGAVAFWPLAAAAVAGGIELIGVLRARRQGGYGATGYGAVAGPGAPGYHQAYYPARSDQPAEWPPPPDPPAEPSGPGGDARPGVSGWPAQPADDSRHEDGQTNPAGGDQGRAAL
jgi:hypothetical protein